MTKKRTSSLMQIRPGLIRTVSGFEGSTRGRWQMNLNGQKYAIRGDVVDNRFFVPDAKYRSLVDEYAIKHSDDTPAVASTTDEPSVVEAPVEISEAVEEISNPEAANVDEQPSGLIARAKRFLGISF